MLEYVEYLTQFGVAGLMGALWVWERMYSRKREQQLTQAHAHLEAQHTELITLLDLVERNTAAIERFERTQARLADLIEHLEQDRRAA